MLGSDLYHRFLKIENQFRAYANKVLIQHLGQNWLDRPGLEQYKDSLCSMKASFKQIVPQLANINTSLLSMTLETLSKVILKAVIYKENATLTSAELTRLYQYLEKRNEQAAKEFVEEKRETKINRWNDVFSQYFTDPEQFKKQLNLFIKARNHIVHNIGKYCYCGCENEHYVCELWGRFMTIWAAMSIYVMGICRQIIED